MGSGKKKKKSYEMENPGRSLLFRFKVLTGSGSTGSLIWPIQPPCFTILELLANHLEWDLTPKQALAGITPTRPCIRGVYMLKYGSR